MLGDNDKSYYASVFVPFNFLQVLEHFPHSPFLLAKSLQQTLSSLIGNFSFIDGLDMSVNLRLEIQ